MATRTRNERDRSCGIMDVRHLPGAVAGSWQFTERAQDGWMQTHYYRTDMWRPHRQWVRAGEMINNIAPACCWGPAARPTRGVGSLSRDAIGSL